MVCSVGGGGRHGGLLNNENICFAGGQEFPIVRAFAAMTLLNLYEKRPSDSTSITRSGRWNGSPRVAAHG